MHETNENYTAMKGTSSFLGYNVLLLLSRAALLVVDSQTWQIWEKSKI